MQPRVLTPHSNEIQNLEIAAKLLTRFNKRGFTYKVEETWFDLGQNWRWTTIIAYDTNVLMGPKSYSSYQTLNPAEWERIAIVNDMYDLTDIINDLMKEKNLI